jgi:hypothetical protein
MKALWVRSAVSLVVVLMILVALFPVQKEIDAKRGHWTKEEELLYLPSGNMLKIISLGFDEAMSDILYIRMINYFGTHLMTDRTYTWLYHMADLVTTLDPYFRFPYIFAGLVLNLEGHQFENARKILTKGMKVFPGDWYFPFVLGLNYFFGSADFETAASLLDKSYTLGGPKYLHGFAVKLRAKGKTRQTSLEFLYFLYDRFHDKNMKKLIIDRITELETGGR